jgi:hypothetical protein
MGCYIHDMFAHIAWTVIRADLMAAFDMFWCMDTCSFHSINDTYMVLLPKSGEAARIKDYRAISLIHSVGNLFSKILAHILTPKLFSLMHLSQSAIIQGRTIHEYFRFVQGSAKLLHIHRIPTLLLKTDIAHAFDSVVCPFLLEILHHLGFPRAWLNLVSTLLATGSTKVLLNGASGNKICHARGLHQGDLLSLMLFLLVMEVLGALI